MSDTVKAAASDGLSVRFHGVRGTTPVPGTDTVLFGGNTSCLEVTAAGRRFTVDAGSGMLPLSDGLRPKPAAGDHFDLLLTHLHHDHTLGLMSFAPFFVEGVSVNIYCGNRNGETAEEPLRRLYSPPLFPLTFDDLGADVGFVGFRAGETLRFGPVTVRTHLLNHPGGSTGYRFEAGGHAILILADVEHAGSDPDPSLVAFSRDADLIIYDASYDIADYPRFRGWGHSTWRSGAKLALAADARRLACFHHAPEYDDKRLLAMEEALRQVFPSGFFAREGTTVDLAERREISETNIRAGAR